MKISTKLFCALLAGAMCGGVAQAAETLEAVEKKIIALADKQKTMSAKMTGLTKVEGQQLKISSKTDGTYEYAVRGDKVLFRMEAQSSGTTRVVDQPEMKNESKSLSVADGQFIYALTEDGDQKMAVKMKQDPARSNVSGKALFDWLKKSHELKLLPDEKIDGREVYVIEATPRKPEEGAKARQVYCFAKDSGIMVKTVVESRNAQGKTNVTFTLTDIKLNPDLKPERFEFKPPAGVEVMDMTQMGETTHDAGQAAPAADVQEPPSAKPADPPPAEKPKEEKKRGFGLPGIKNPLK